MRQHNQHQRLLSVNCKVHVHIQNSILRISPCNLLICGCVILSRKQVDVYVPHLSDLHFYFGSRFVDVSWVFDSVVARIILRKFVIFVFPPQGVYGKVLLVV